MAEVNTGDGGGGGKHGKKRAKKSSTKIDMTPMVDLAFLLLTFFMLTTTFSKPQAMEINMPVKPPEGVPRPQVDASTLMTIILSENNKVYYYFGMANDAKVQMELTDFGPNGVRKALLKRNQATLVRINKLKSDFERVTFKDEKDKKVKEKELKKQIVEVKKDKKAMMVLIKTDEKAKYKNVVDIMDEMSICNIPKYALVDIDPKEVELIQKLNN